MRESYSDLTFYCIILVTMLSFLVPGVLLGLLDRVQVITFGVLIIVIPLFGLISTAIGIAGEGN